MWGLEPALMVTITEVMPAKNRSRRAVCSAFLLIPTTTDHVANKTELFWSIRHVLKRSYYFLGFFFFFCWSFIVFCSILAHIKGLQSEKVHAKGRYSLPQKTLLLHHLIHLGRSRAFASITCACASLCNSCSRNIYFHIFFIRKYSSLSWQTHSCYYCSCVILDHTTLFVVTRPNLPLIGYTLPIT